MGKLGNIVSAAKVFLNFFGNIFASWKANFVSATMFPEVGKQGNIGRKHNVSAKMFPGLPRAYKISVSRFNFDKNHGLSSVRVSLEMNKKVKRDMGLM